MSPDWRGLTLGLLMALGGSLIGYGYGHHGGEQDSAMPGLATVTTLAFLAGAGTAWWVASLILPRVQRKQVKL